MNFPMMTTAVLLVSAWNLTVAFQEEWRATKVSVSTRNAANIEISLFTGGKFRAAVNCGKTELCYAFCETNPGEFSFLQLKVVPSNEDPNGAPYLDCYTNRLRSILTGQSNITIHAATGAALGYPIRIPTNLLKGYCYDNYNIIYMSQRNTQAFVVFDLGAEHAVRKIIVHSETENGAVHRRFTSFEVRVGTTPQSGDFTSYTLMGSMTDIPQYGWYEFHTNAPAPVSGRYVSIQCMDTSLEIALCMVEIFI